MYIQSFLKSIILLILPYTYTILYIGSIGAALGFGRSKANSAQAGTSERTGTAKKDTATAQRQRQTGTVGRAGTKATSGTTTKQQTGRQDISSLISNLDAGTQEQLQEILKSIGTPSDIKALSGALSSRALNAGQALAANTKAAVDVARRRGERRVGQTVTNLAKSAGSGQNSLVAQLGLEADTNLQVELAGLESTLNAANRRQSTEELQGALKTQTSSVSEISSILKGATQQTTQQTNTSQLSSALQNLLETSRSSEVRDLLSELLGSTSATQVINEKGKTTGNFSGRGSSLNAGISGSFSI